MSLEPLPEPCPPATHVKKWTPLGKEWRGDVQVLGTMRGFHLPSSNTGSAGTFTLEERQLPNTDLSINLNKHPTKKVIFMPLHLLKGEKPSWV